MFYVNDEPEGKFLYTETIKLYCIVKPASNLPVPAKGEDLTRHRSEMLIGRSHGGGDSSVVRAPDS